MISLLRILLGLCLASFLHAKPDSQMEPDITAILALVPAKEREGVADFLRAPGPSGHIPSMVAQNSLNSLNEGALAKVAEPLARRMAVLLEDTNGDYRVYAFNTLMRLADEYPAVARLAKPSFERIAESTADSLNERARKFLSETAEERRDAELAHMDKVVTRMLVGVWSEELPGENPGTVEFKADGTFESVIWADAKQTRPAVIFRGKWSAEKRHIVYRTEYCSDPEVQFPQPPIRDKLLEFGSSGLVYEASDGAKVKMSRVKK